MFLLYSVDIMNSTTIFVKHIPLMLLQDRILGIVLPQLNNDNDGNANNNDTLSLYRTFNTEMQLKVLYDKEMTSFISKNI